MRELRTAATQTHCLNFSKDQTQPYTPPPSTEPTAQHLVNRQDTDKSQSLDLSLPDMEQTSSQLKLQYKKSDESEDTVTEAKDEDTKGQIPVPQTEDDIRSAVSNIQSEDMFSDSNTGVSEDCTVTHPTEDGLRSDVTKSPSLDFFYPLAGSSHE